MGAALVMAGQTGDFGTTMRRAREARGISLQQIAAATKISVSVLEALERNDISRLPGGIFSRAFVRSYAIEVGLDPDETVRGFLDEFPHASVTAGSPHVPQEDHQAIESERRSAATAVALAAISVPLAGGILYYTLVAAPPPPAAPTGLTTAERATAAVLVEPLTVGVVATGPVTLVVDVDGVRRESRPVAPGERLVFRAERDVLIAMSDAAAVQLTINGQPAAALGAPGQPRTVQIGRENYGALLASQ